MNVVLLELPTPSIGLLRRAGFTVVLLALVALGYDLRVLDLSATKVAVFQLAVATWAIAVLAGAMREPIRRPALGLPLLVAFWAIVPSIARGLPATHILAKPVYLAFLVLCYVLMRRTLRQARAWPGLVWAVTGLAAVLSSSAIIEAVVLGGDPTFGGAPVVTLGNPNHLGALLVLALPAVFTASDGQHPAWRRGILGVAAATLVAIAATGSHLALLGASGMLGVLAANPGVPARTRRWTVGALVVVLVLAVVTRSMWVGPAAAADPQQSVTGELQAPASKLATSPGAVELPTASDLGALRALHGRLYLARIGLQVVAEAPLLGVGFGEYPWAFAAHQADYLEQRPAQRHFHTRLEHAHNDPLELLAEAGLVGLAALVLGLLWAHRLAARHGEPEDQADVPTTMKPAFAITGVLLFAVMGFGHFVLFDPPNAVLAAAYLACLRGQRLAMGPLAARVQIGVVLLLVVAGLAATLRAYSAERLVVDGIEAMHAGDLVGAEEALATAQRRFPSGEVLFYRGTARLLDGDLDTAIELLTGAAYLVPYAEVHANLGLALCKRGYGREAISRLEQAVRLDPTRSETRVVLAACTRALEGE